MHLKPLTVTAEQVLRSLSINADHTTAYSLLCLIASFTGWEIIASFVNARLAEQDSPKTPNLENHP